MPQCDVAPGGSGANDVVRTPRRGLTRRGPIFGMPIIRRGQGEETVYAIKRSKNRGFAGIDNELYFQDKTFMLFGTRKAVVGELVKQIHHGGGH